MVSGLDTTGGTLSSGGCARATTPFSSTLSEGTSVTNLTIYVHLKRSKYISLSICGTRYTNLSIFARFYPPFSLSVSKTTFLGLPVLIIFGTLQALSKYLAAVSEIVAVRLKVSASGLQTHYVSKMVTVVHDDP